MYRMPGKSEQSAPGGNGPPTGAVSLNNTSASTLEKETAESNGTGTENQNPPRPPSTAQDKVPLIFVVNLVLLIASGTWFCIWLLHYTDRFEGLAQVLALGGGLTWLAFVLKLLSEERLKAFQRDLDRFVFSHWWLTLVLLAACAVGFYLRAHYGALQVELFLGSEDRVLTVSGAGLLDDSWRLSPGQKVRIPVWTSSSSPVPLNVKVSGYPDLRVRIAPHERRELRIPSAFMRRVVLLKPSADMIPFRTQGFRLRVKLNGKLLTDDIGKPVKDFLFEGYPIWIGADVDVIVPQATIQRWSAALTDDTRNVAMEYLQHPQALTKTSFDLNSGDRICVEILHSDGSRYSHKNIIVSPIEPGHDFSQEEEIDARSDQNGEDPSGC